MEKGKESSVPVGDMIDYGSYEAIIENTTILQRLASVIPSAPPMGVRYKAVPCTITDK